MKHITLDERWPEAWKAAYAFDAIEVYGDRSVPHHRYPYEVRFRHTMELVRSALPDGGSILDVAAAQGNFSIALAEAGYDVTWNDIREDLFGYVQKKLERGSLKQMPGNLFCLPGSHRFDLVLMGEVIEHVAHPDAFLMKAAELVKPQGRIVLTTPNGRFCRNKLPRFSDCPDPSVYEAQQFAPDGDGHIFLLHPDELVALAARAGLQVAELRLFNSALTCGLMRTRGLMRRFPKSVVMGLEGAAAALPWPVRSRLEVGMAALLAT